VLASILNLSGLPKDHLSERLTLVEQQQDPFGPGQALGAGGLDGPADALAAHFSITNMQAELQPGRLELWTTEKTSERLDEDWAETSSFHCRQVQT
jgi:hypothetical protein